MDLETPSGEPHDRRGHVGERDAGELTLAPPTFADYTQIAYEVHGDVAVITLNRPIDSMRGGEPVGAGVVARRRSARRSRSGCRRGCGAGVGVVVDLGGVEHGDRTPPGAALPGRVGVVGGAAVVVRVEVGELPEDASVAALALADLRAEGGPLLVCGSAGGQVVAVEGGEVEGDDVSAAIAIAGGGASWPAGRADRAPRHVPGVGAGSMPATRRPATSSTTSAAFMSTRPAADALGSGGDVAQYGQPLGDVVRVAPVTYWMAGAVFDPVEELGGVDRAQQSGFDAEGAQEAVAAAVVDVEARRVLGAASAWASASVCASMANVMDIRCSLVGCPSSGSTAAVKRRSGATSRGIRKSEREAPFFSRARDLVRDSRETHSPRAGWPARSPRHSPRGRAGEGRGRVCPPPARLR